ncbi:MAG: M56 family metallopeptidase [Candidatus Algichlamydia australiensis]|nr:M56 family metallopeptidase [Chlamydiales bacterium]
MEKSKLFWFLSFDLITNSLLALFTAVILVEFVLFIFRVKSIRGRIFARLLPLFKLLLDPFLYDYSRWSLLLGKHPIFAEKGSRYLSVIFSDPITGVFSRGFRIGFCLEDCSSFSLGDLVAFYLPSHSIKFAVIVCFVISFFLLASRLKNVFCTKKVLQAFPKEPCQRSLKHSLLSESLKKRSIQIYVSDAISAPCAIAPKAILFPKRGLKSLTDEEFAVIVAHEQQHLCFKDSTIRLGVYFFTALFWWIPSWGWQRGLEAMQEKAADTGALRWGFSKLALVTAIGKFAIQKNEESYSLMTSAFCRRWSVVRRLKQIAKLNVPKERKIVCVLKGSLVMILLLDILFSSLWIL